MAKIPIQLLQKNVQVILRNEQVMDLSTGLEKHRVPITMAEDVMQGISLTLVVQMRASKRRALSKMQKHKRLMNKTETFQGRFENRRAENDSKNNQLHVHNKSKKKHESKLAKAYAASLIKEEPESVTVAYTNQ